MDRSIFVDTSDQPTAQAKLRFATALQSIDAAPPPPQGSLATYPFQELVVSLDERQRIFWCWFKPRGRACFSKALLSELRIMQRLIRALPASSASGDPGFDYMVVGSKSAGAFNLGGDLILFHHLVRAGDRDALRQYAKLCVDVVRDNAESYGTSIVTIANVKGSCLGGGFEAALSCDVIFAEEHVKFGFPEILFGLFPGMGAINFLSRRVGWRKTEQLLMSGRTYTAQDMCDFGLVHHVVARGEGDDEVMRYIKKHKRRASTHAVVCESLRTVEPLTDQEFERITELWVDTAMQLSDRDLSKMLKLAQAQTRKQRQPVVAS